MLYARQYLVRMQRPLFLGALIDGRDHGWKEVYESVFSQSKPLWKDNPPRDKQMPTKKEKGETQTRKKAENGIF